MIRRDVAFLTLAALIALSGAPEAAGPATEQLRPQIERVRQALEDPALKGAGKAEERRQVLRQIIDAVFDWTEMARGALGPHWEGRSEAEREEFSALFRDLVERAYLSRIERYDGESVAYASETAQGAHAVVRSQILSGQGQQVAIDYRMLRRGDRWLVYDIVVEGVSLTANYRSQFNQIIRTSSYEELVRKIRSRAS